MAGTPIGRRPPEPEPVGAAGRQKAWAGCAVCAIGVVLSCAGAIGNAMSEGPVEGGHIGQQPIQKWLVAFLSLAAFLQLAIAGVLLAKLSSFRLEPETATWVKLAGIWPLLGGLGLIVAGILRVVSGGIEGAVLVMLGFLPIGLGVGLWRTRREDYY